MTYKRLTALTTAFALANLGLVGASTGAFGAPVLQRQARVAPAAQAGARTIALLNGSNEDPYFYSIWAGALAAAKQHGVKLIEEAPSTFDYTSQVPLFEDLLAKKVSGIVLSADGSGNTFNAELAQAKRDHIPVDIVNATAGNMNNNPNVISFITSSNLALAELAGQKICSILHGKGLVGILNSSVTVLPDLQRVTGLQKYMGAHCPAVKLLPQVVTQDSIATADSDATDLIEAHPNLSLLYGVDAFNAEGILTALKDTKKMGTIKEVAIDAEPKEVAAVKAGQLAAIVAQQPYKVGYVAVQYLWDAITGHMKAVARNVTPPGIVLTKANIGEAQYKDVPYAATIP